MKRERLNRRAAGSLTHGLFKLETITASDLILLCPKSAADAICI